MSFLSPYHIFLSKLVWSLGLLDSSFCYFSLRRLTDNINSYDHETSSLRRQLDSTNEELTEVGRAREVSMRENRRLQDDLATMTRENQVSYGETVTE